MKANQNHKNANALLRLPLLDNGILSFANVGSRARSSSGSSGRDEESRLDLAPVFVSIHALMSCSGAPCKQTF